MKGSTNILMTLLGLAAVGAPFVFLQHYLDISRIRKIALSKGWREITVKTERRAYAAIAEKNERVYRVDYVNRDNEWSSAICKTSFLGGTFWMDD